MIDLHTHTMYSDGTDTIEEYLKKAESMKLTNVSITDHNTCKAYEELDKINLKDFYSGNIITGVELNTKVLSIPIEIVIQAFLRPISSSSALVMMLKVFNTYGTNSNLGLLSSIIQGCSDTTFYIVTLYFSCVKIKKSHKFTKKAPLFSSKLT